ncbi:helix-turn-helix transcriptional regulator [Paenibacillus sp. FSL L8-0708]|uniref:helix-turn-helix transcriptional regulator n=1 Tax=Paenibacillus sp. FSL L8-0708 TaxID=2975311 RepID=UPI0030F7E789
MVFKILDGILNTIYNQNTNTRNEVKLVNEALTRKREKLRDRRLEKGFTQAKLADKVGVSLEQIKSLEYGRVNPSFVLMLNICSVLNSRPEEIF